MPVDVRPLSNDRLLVNATSGWSVDTGVFLPQGKGVIVVLDRPTVDHPEGGTPSHVQAVINQHVGGGNDGGLAWIPATLADAFVVFLPGFLQEASDNNKLNFVNGPVSEAFVLYPVADGLVVATIDPECGTSVFEDALSAFEAEQGLSRTVDTTMFDPQRVFYYETAHLSSSLRIGEEEPVVDRFLAALYERGLLTEEIVVGIDVPQASGAWLDGRNVTITGKFSVPRAEIDDWLEENGTVLTETPGANGLLLVGAKPGASKLAKAAKNHTERVTMLELMHRLIDDEQKEAQVSQRAPAPTVAHVVPTGTGTVFMGITERVTPSIRLVNVAMGAEVDTQVFARAKADALVVAYDTTDQNFENADDGSWSDVRTMLEAEIHSNPDGGVLWVPQAYAEGFRLVAHQAFVDAIANNTLTFDKGGLSEGLFVHTTDDGLAVMLFDPECGTSFFETLIDTFSRDWKVPHNDPAALNFDPKRLQWFESSHLLSNMVIGRHIPQDRAMLGALYERGLLDERFAMDLNVTLSGELAKMFEHRAVATTGRIASEDYTRDWLEHTAGATVVDSPVEGGLLLVGEDADPVVMLNAIALGCQALHAKQLVKLLLAA